MDRDETKFCPETDRQPESRAGAVTLIPDPRRENPSSRRIGGRPMAPFVTQLIVSVDPSLRPTRLERTQAAAALYGQTGRQRRA